MAELNNTIEMDQMEMRAAYCESLIDAARRDPRIVAIDCDLSNSCGTKDFKNVFPQRYFNVGIGEQNGCAMAGGLSAVGMVPFFHSFGVFATRRIYDQIFMSCAYAGQNVKIIGCDAGISAAFNGGTHMAFEDANIMRVMPHVTVVEPTDTVMMRELVPQIAAMRGVCYLRMPRKKVQRIYVEGSRFEIGKAVVLRQGTDVSILASGMEVVEALQAAENLAKEGIQARVVDVFTLKPVDKTCILECAEQTGAVVTAENGFITGGLGSAVAEVLSDNCPTPLERVGVNEEFGEVGNIGYLKSRFGLTSESIVKAAKKAMARKR